MNRTISRWFLTPLLALATTGCGGDPVRHESTIDFNGTWILRSTILPAEMSCSGGEPNDTQIEEVTIAQTAREAALQFADYSATGTVAGGTLSASGTLPSGESVSFELARAGEALEGTVQVAGNVCQERRTAVATRRPPDADFSGHWSFELTVTSEDGCRDIVDYTDCFRIIQSGRDLLVVDDEAGNLTGTVTGNIAQIERSNATEAASLIFFINDTEDRLTGSAVRALPSEGCRTDLTFVGTLRDEPCANAAHGTAH